MENLKLELKKYIDENFIEESPFAQDSYIEDFISDYGKHLDVEVSPSFIFCSTKPPNFKELLAKNSGETFSEMLLRLVNESGEKNSAIYNRANIDRRLFSKILHSPDYQPTKNTALAFAVALKLNYQTTQKFLQTAGFTLNKKKLSDVIITFCIEKNLFDIETINDFLYEYKQPLIGGGQKFCRPADDHFKTQGAYNADKAKEVLNMANVTEIVFILDRSGSMQGLENDTIGGFNSMLAKHKNGENAAFVSTVLFDDVSEVIHDRLPIADVPNLTENEYFVRGMTALLDAIGDAVKHIRNIHKYARPEDVPAKTIFIITTDGMENASQRYSYDDIKKLIETQKENGWDFVFMGANIDSVQVASRMGIRANRAVNYHNDARGTKARYSAMDNFVSAAFAAPSMSAVDDAWREVVDKDFTSRKKNKK